MQGAHCDPRDRRERAVQGDLDNPETISPAMAAGVGHVVLLSSLGVEAGVASGPFHAPGEERLRSSSLSWTIIRPGFYMANALMWRDTVIGQPGL